MKRWRLFRDKSGTFLRLDLWYGRIKLHRVPPDESGELRAATFYRQYDGRWLPEPGPTFGAETARREAHQFWVDRITQMARIAVLELEET